eukprot:g3809.t1
MQSPSPFSGQKAQLVKVNVRQTIVDTYRALAYDVRVGKASRWAIFQSRLPGVALTSGGMLVGFLLINKRGTSCHEAVPRVEHSSLMYDMSFRPDREMGFTRKLERAATLLAPIQHHVYCWMQSKVDPHARERWLGLTSLPRAGEAGGEDNCKKNADEELRDANVPDFLANIWTERGFLSQKFLHKPNLARVSIDSVKKAQETMEYMAEKFVGEEIWDHMKTQDNKLQGLLDPGVDTRTRDCAHVEGTDNRTLVDSTYPHYSYAFLKQTHDSLSEVGVVKIEGLIPLAVIRDMRRKFDIAPLRHCPYDKIQSDWREDVKKNGLSGDERGANSWLSTRDADEYTSEASGKSIQLYHTLSEFDCRRFDPQYIMQFSYEKTRARVWKEKQKSQSENADFIDSSVDTDRIWARGPKALDGVASPGGGGAAGEAEAGGRASAGTSAETRTAGAGSTLTTSGASRSGSSSGPATAVSTGKSVAKSGSLLEQNTTASGTTTTTHQLATVADAEQPGDNPYQRERKKQYLQADTKSNVGFKGRRWETFDELAELWLRDYDPKDENPVIPNSGTCIGRTYYFMKNTHFERAVQPLLTCLTPLVNTYFETTAGGRAPYVSGITLGVSNSRCLDEAWHRDSKTPCTLVLYETWCSAATPLPSRCLDEAWYRDSKTAGVTFVVPLTNIPENLGSLNVMGYSHLKRKKFCEAVKSGAIGAPLKVSDILVYDQRCLLDPHGRFATKLLCRELRCKQVAARLHLVLRSNLKRANPNPAYTRTTIALFVSYNVERPPGFGPPTMYFNSFVGNCYEKLHGWQTMRNPVLSFLDGIVNRVWDRWVLPVHWDGRDLGLELGWLTDGTKKDAYDMGVDRADKHY